MNDALIWVPLAIVAAMSGAGMVLLTEYRKHPIIPRLFWLRLFSFGAMLCVTPFIIFPSAPLFYVCVLALSVCICITDILYFTSARDNGAGPTSRIEPLSVLLTFVAWSILVPAQLQAYMAKPWIALGIAACFVLAGYCAMQLRHCAVSLATVKKLIPVIVLIALVNMLGKTAMDAAGGVPLHAALVYLLIQTGLLSLFYAGVCFFQPQRVGSLRPDRRLLVSAALMALCSIAHVVPKNIAYTYVSNPAYVVVIGLTAPLFVSGFYRLAGRSDHAAVWAGFGIVISAVFLVVLTRF